MNKHTNEQITKQRFVIMLHNKNEKHTRKFVFFVVNKQTKQRKYSVVYIYYCSKSSSLIGTLKRIYSS